MELAEPGKKGALVLEDGTVIQGVGFGAETEISGEVVFNTSMMGYPELLTDPSYQEQIVVMTYPILGSYGVPPSSIRGDGGVPLHFESDSVKVKGFVVHSLSRPSHWSNQTTSTGDLWR
jgi:carbamoyl-phosphate synthase small subunit